MLPKNCFRDSCIDAGQSKTLNWDDPEKDNARSMKYKLLTRDADLLKKLLVVLHNIAASGGEYPISSH